MKLSITDLSYEGKWFQFQEGVRLKIRPFPLSQGNFVMRDGDMVLSNKDQVRIFSHSLEAWEGVVGADDKPLPCTDEVKQKVFDFGLCPEMVKFVADKTREFLKLKEEREKN